MTTASGTMSGGGYYEMNRAQRRAAATKHSARKKVGRPAMTLQPAMGQAVSPLERPVAVGEISGPEAVEIRALNELVSNTEKEMVRWQQLVTVTRNQRTQFLKAIVERKGLDMRNVYSINDDSGVIVQTHRYIEPEPETEPEVAESAQGPAAPPSLAVVPESSERPRRSTSR